MVTLIINKRTIYVSRIPRFDFQIETGRYSLCPHFDEHNELDDKISGLENNPVTSVTAQDEIDALKVKKLALKDQLFQLLKQAEAEGK